MNNKDKKIYQDRYNKRLTEFGDDPKTLGWGGGKERQYLRFETLSAVGINKQDSVLDVGCGFGDFYEFSKTKKLNLDYTGLDINSELLSIAKKKNPEAQWLLKDIQTEALPRKYDWVIESGIFNAKLKFENNLEYIEKMMTKMFELSIKGIACDFMSTYVDFQHEDAYHADPADIIKIAKSLSWPVNIRMDYLPYEYCVYLYK